MYYLYVGDMVDYAESFETVSAGIAAARQHTDCLLVCENGQPVAWRRPSGDHWEAATASCSRCGEELWGEAAVQMQWLDGELVCDECGEGDYPAVRQELAASLFDALQAWVTAATDKTDLPATAKRVIEERLRRGLGGDAELDDLFRRVFGFGTNDVGR